MSFYNPSHYLATQGIGLSPGAQVFYVNNGSALAPGGIGGSDGNSGLSPQEPLSTVDKAIDLCTAGRGDVILAMPGHAETMTAVQTLDKVGVQLVGVKVGNKRPVFTVNGAVDLFSFTAANCLIQGVEMNIVTTDSATAFVNVAAASCKIKDIKMIPSATSVNVVDVITIASGGDDFHFEDIDCRNTTVAVNSFISIEAAVARLTGKNSFFFGDAATAGIIDGAVAATQLFLDNVFVGTIGSTIPAATLDGNPTGVIHNCKFLGTHTTLATNFNPGNATRLVNNWVLEETDASVQASNIVPALDTN